MFALIAMVKSVNMDYAQKMQRCNEYIEALEEERSKIQVFQRELPLCLEIVNRTIEACKKELSGTTTEYPHCQSECSEQTTGECGPVLEEFIPLKRSSSYDEDDEQESHNPRRNDKFSSNNTDKNKKSDWLRSAQLWNQSPDPLPKEKRAAKNETAVDVNTNGGAFQPLQQQKSVPKAKGKDNEKSGAASASVSSTNSGEKNKESEAKRKQRRCWSADLHRLFLNALQQLGGSHVATPKQIRESMKVDGLTNDEVKSHLQKYRLHTRRPSQTNPSSGNPHSPPHFVVVGGLWAPQPDYTAATVANGIYTAVAAPPAPPRWPVHTNSEPWISKERTGSHSTEGVVQYNSPATSSSTRTNTM